MADITWGTAAATLAVPLVLLLPGWALLSLLLPRRVGSVAASPAGEPTLDAASWLVLSVCLTLAIVPVGVLLLSLVGLKAGPGLALAGLVLSAALIVWHQGPGYWQRWQQSSWSQRLAWLDAPFIALGAVTLLVLGVRLWVVRGLNIGFWGDSFQHTLITQLILDNGGLFRSWEPYAPLQSFSYHFGLHANIAFFQWATGWLTHNATSRVVVLFGQFLNALAVLALYPLAVRLSGGKRWVGVLAALIAGLLTPMPMFYVNWGRYTQLAGQAILPAALWLTLDTIETERHIAGRLAAAVLAVAGLALTHYFVLAFYVLFWVPYLAAWTVRCWRQWPRLRAGWLRLAAIGGLAVLVVLPWMARLLDGLLLRILSGYVQGTPAQDFIELETAFFPLIQFLPYYVAALALGGGLWALIRRHQPALLLFWTGCLFLLSNPDWLRLPGNGVVTNFTVEIALYIPAAILAAYLVVSALAALGQIGGRWLAALVARRPVQPAVRLAAGLAAIVLLLAVGWLGARQRLGVIDTQYQLVTPADEQALAWIRANTPPESCFLVNSFFAYGGSLIAGSDAGWWLPLLTGRCGTVPPLNYGSEAGPDADYGQRTNALTSRLERSELQDAATVRYLRRQGITHVFIGEKGGTLLDPAVLQASPYYRAVYLPAAGAAGPWVFEIIAP